MRDTVLLLAVLACPIGMGLMMLFMGRGMMGNKKGEAQQNKPSESPSSLDDLRSEQADIAARIERLEQSGRANGQEMAQSL